MHNSLFTGAQRNNMKSNGSTCQNNHRYKINRKRRLDFTPATVLHYHGPQNNFLETRTGLDNVRRRLEYPSPPIKIKKTYYPPNKKYKK